MGACSIDFCLFLRLDFDINPRNAMDVHSDCNTPDISPSGNIHGIPVANLLGLGPQPLIGLSGQTPALSAEHFCQVGLRSVDDHEKRMIHQLGKITRQYSK